MQATKMEEEDKQSKWDDLARELGAEIRPGFDASRPKQDAPPESPAAAAPTSQSAAPLPKKPPRAPSDWDGLASDLGLEVRPKEVAEPAEYSSELPATDETTAAPIAPEPVEEPIDTGTSEDRDVDVSEASDIAYGDEPAEETDAPVAEQPSQPTASVEPPKTLWERIFGSPGERVASDEGPNAEEVASGDESAVIETKREAEVPAWDTERPTRVADDVAREGSEVQDKKEDGSAGLPSERERKRRRPRRRRRRGARTSEDSDPVEQVLDEVQDVETLDESEAAVDVFDEQDERHVERTGKEVSGSSEKKPSGRRSGERTKKAAHRSIPSWEEAISVVVDANMEHRSERRQHSRSNSRSKPSRGQGRGRRRKRS